MRRVGMGVSPSLSLPERGRVLRILEVPRTAETEEDDMCKSMFCESISLNGLCP